MFSAQIYGAALWAVKLQIAALVIITPWSIISAKGGGADWTNRLDELIALPNFQFQLTVLYFVVAYAIGMTRSRPVRESALSIYAECGAGAKYLAERLHGQCAFVCIAAFPVALHKPPFIFNWLAKQMDLAGAGPIIWAALISILAAGFGATAHAAFLATRLHE